MPCAEQVAIRVLVLRRDRSLDARVVASCVAHVQQGAVRVTIKQRAERRDRVILALARRFPPTSLLRTHLLDCFRRWNIDLPDDCGHLGICIDFFVKQLVKILREVAENALRDGEHSKATEKGTGATYRK